MPDNRNNNSKPDLPEGRPPTPKGGRTALTVFFLLLVLFASFLLFDNKPSVQEIPYSAFLTYLDLGQVESVQILDQKEIHGSLRSEDGSAVAFITNIPYTDPELMTRLESGNVKVSGGEKSASPLQIIFGLIPWIFGLVLIWSMMRQMQGNNRAFDFGKSRAKRYV